MMKEAQIINSYFNLKNRLAAIGLTVMIDYDIFIINDAPKAKGQLRFENIDDLDKFTRGYELGYGSGL